MDLEVLHYPNPLLKEPTVVVTDFDAELADFVAKLYRAMRIHDGVGLAAPQVGVLKKIAVVEHDDRSTTLINPRVLEQSQELEEAEEGCLSFPGLYAVVRRPRWARIEAQDETGETRVLEAEGFTARAFLHEMDHLNGRLFIDYLSPLKRNAIKKKMAKQTKQGAPKSRRAR